MAIFLNTTLGDKIPLFYRNPDNNFWAILIMCVAIFPLSLFKELKSLTYICLFGFLVTIYITFVIMIEPFKGDLNGFSLEDNLSAISYFKASGM